MRAITPKANNVTHFCRLWVKLADVAETQPQGNYNKYDLSGTQVLK